MWSAARRSASCCRSWRAPPGRRAGRRSRRRRRPSTRGTPRRHRRPGCPTAAPTGRRTRCRPVRNPRPGRVRAVPAAVVGDLVDGSVAELGPHAEPLRGLRSRRGSFFVTGNHEYFSGYQEWVEEIDSFGVKVLRNQRVEIDGLDLAGVNDLTGGAYGDGPDLDRALGGRDSSRPVVLLAHQPRQAHEAARHNVDLLLAGHTHGGQLWPFHYVVRATQQPLLAGLGKIDGLPVYVTRGAGFWGPPVRVGAPPDVTLVELRATQ